MNVLQKNWIKSVWRETSILWGIPERDPCMHMEEDNLVENLQCTTEAWWIFPITSGWLLSRSYLMMTEEVPHGYVPVFQQWYTLLFRATWNLHRKSVFQTKVHLKSSITLTVMKVQKGESDSPIHISTDEQISRHFGKRWKSLRIQAEACGDYFLTEKGRDDSQFGREHWKYYWRHLFFENEK